MAGVPLWWHPARLPKQVEQTRDYILGWLGPEAHRAKPVNGALFYGPPGTGKTSAGVAVLYTWGKSTIENGQQLGPLAMFQDFAELMLRIRSSWRKDAPMTTEQIIAEMLSPKILMLDDIGKRAAPEDQEALGTIVNARINRGRPTICTTNSDLGTEAGRKEFSAACDTRVLERYRGCTPEVKGQNLRVKS